MAASLSSFRLIFKARRIEHEAGILVCGIYIDLNQIRAGEALTPEESRHTSAYDRIRGRRQRTADKTHEEVVPADGWLCELTLDERAAATDPGKSSERSATRWRASDKGLLPIRLEDYLRLLDWTGRQLAAGKRGTIPQHFAPILDRLGIRRGMWLDLVTQFDRLFGHVVGRAEQLVTSAARAGRRWYRGRAVCGDAFG